jgi:hypothetical protein
MYLPDDLARAIDGGGGIESKDAPRKTPQFLTFLHKVWLHFPLKT